MSVNNKGRHFYSPGVDHQHDFYFGYKPLPVDEFLALYDALPADQQIVKPFEAFVPVYIAPVDPNRATPRPRVITVEDKRLCSPKKLADYDALYLGGSHHQSMWGTLKHIFNRARRNNIALDYNDMSLLLSELDMRHGNYVTRNYSGDILKQEIRKIMKG